MTRRLLSQITAGSIVLLAVLRLYHCKERHEDLPVAQRAEPQGIARTCFEDAVVEYKGAVSPQEVLRMDDCLKQFGRKAPVNFNQLPLASLNKSL
jgi:hypothetical protein